MNRFILVAMLSFSFAACHSRQEPKPVEWKKGALTTAQAAQKLKDAERQQPCSQENRKKATEEQKHRCDPTRGMFDNVKPVAPSAIPNHQKSKRP